MMVELFQGILISFTSVLFTKFIDSIWPNKELSKNYLYNTLHVRSEVNVEIAHKKTLSQQINHRVFLSKNTYYVITLLMLYCFLSLTSMFLYVSQAFFHHPLKPSILSDLIIQFSKNKNDPLSFFILKPSILSDLIIQFSKNKNDPLSFFIAFLIYPLINFISRVPFKLIIAFLNSMNFTFTEENVQQIRMAACFSLSALLALSIIYYLY